MIPALMVYALSIGGGLFIALQRKRFTESFKWLGWYLLASGIFQITAGILRMKTGSNVLFYKATIPITLILIYLIFKNILASAKLSRALLAACILTLALIGLRMVTFFWASPSISDLLVPYNICVVVFALLYFTEMLQKPELVSPFAQPNFWLVGSIFFYFLVSIGYWLSGFVLEFSSVLLSKLNTWMVILFYVLLWVAIVKQWQSARKLAA